MADRAYEVTLREGTLRVELNGAGPGEPGHLSAWLDGKPVSRERALELAGKARRRMGMTWRCESCGSVLTWPPPVESNPGPQECPRCGQLMRLAPEIGQGAGPEPAGPQARP